VRYIPAYSVVRGQLRQVSVFGMRGRSWRSRGQRFSVAQTKKPALSEIGRVRAGIATASGETNAKRCGESIKRRIDPLPLLTLRVRLPFHASQRADVILVVRENREIA
jgi:hypothetical protein